MLQALHDLDHPTADEVYLHVKQALPRIGLATVYRNLDALVAKGRARVRDIGDAKRYDPNTVPHIHIHDPASDRLVDVPLTPRLQEALAEVAEEYLSDHQDSVIELRGTIKE